MKVLQIVITLSLLALSSCGSPTQILSSVLDYRPYTDNGFFISPNQYPGEHQPLGEISIMVVPGIKEISHDFAEGDDDDIKFNDPLYVTASRSSGGKMHITPEYLLELCVQKAVDMGANGISNFKCEIVYKVSKSQYVTVSSIDHYEVYGLGIKIKN